MDMQRNVLHTRNQVFRITKSFKKAVPLPSAKSWRVKDTEVAARGHILCGTKSKGFLFDRLTNLEPRLVTLTRTGLLIIYIKDDKGYVADVKSAKVLTTETEKLQTKQQICRRCTIKLKFEYGSACLIMFNEDIPVWRTAIAIAHDGLPTSDPDSIGKHQQPPIVKPSMENSIKNDIKIAQVEKESSPSSPSGDHSSTSITTCVKAECVIPTAQDSSEITVEIPEESEPISVIEVTQLNASAVKRLPNDVTSPDDNTQMGKRDLSLYNSLCRWVHRETKLRAEQVQKCASESSNSGLLTELSADMSKTGPAKSLRCGYVSVATLRGRLEAKLQGKEIKKEKKHTDVRNSGLTKTKMTNDSLAHKEGFRTRKEVSAAPNAQSPPPKTRHLGKSQSKTSLESIKTRRHNELPGTKSYDDCLVPVPCYGDLGTRGRTAKGSHTTETKLGKYYSNQWWAQSSEA